MRWFATRSKVQRTLLGLGLVLLIFGISKVISGCTDEGQTPSSNGFLQPPVRLSSSGRLNTTLNAAITTNAITSSDTGQVNVIHGPTYEGRFPGPTLSVIPGDTLNIDVV